MKMRMSLTEQEQVTEFMTPAEFIETFSMLYNSGVTKMPNPNKELSSERPRKQT